jgi:hypothetical protein
MQFAVNDERQKQCDIKLTAEERKSRCSLDKGFRLRGDGDDGDSVDAVAWVREVVEMHLRLGVKTAAGKRKPSLDS